SVKAATLAEIRHAAAVFPAATDVTALIVEITAEAGTDADATVWDRSAPTDPLATARPRRESRFDSIFLAVNRRVVTVFSGTSSWLAASLWVLPSRSHMMTATRYLSGNRLTS